MIILFLGIPLFDFFYNFSILGAQGRGRSHQAGHEPRPVQVHRRVPEDAQPRDGAETGVARQAAQGGGILPAAGQPFHFFM